MTNTDAKIMRLWLSVRRAVEMAGWMFIILIAIGAAKISSSVVDGSILNGILFVGIPAGLISVFLMRGGPHDPD